MGTEILYCFPCPIYFLLASLFLQFKNPHLICLHLPQQNNVILSFLFSSCHYLLGHSLRMQFPPSSHPPIELVSRPILIRNPHVFHCMKQKTALLTFLRGGGGGAGRGVRSSNMLVLVTASSFLLAVLFQCFQHQHAHLEHFSCFVFGNKHADLYYQMFTQLLVNRQPLTKTLIQPHITLQGNVPKVSFKPFYRDRPFLK